MDHKRQASIAGYANLISAVIAAYVVLFVLDLIFYDKREIPDLNKVTTFMVCILLIEQGKSKYYRRNKVDEPE